MLIELFRVLIFLSYYFFFFVITFFSIVQHPLHACGKLKCIKAAASTIKRRLRIDSWLPVCDEHKTFSFLLSLSRFAAISLKLKCAMSGFCVKYEFAINNVFQQSRTWIDDDCAIEALEGGAKLLVNFPSHYPVLTADCFHAFQRML